MGQPVGTEQPSRAVLDQSRPGPGPARRLRPGAQDFAVDPRPEQHIGGEQARRPSPDDPDSAH